MRAVPGSRGDRAWKGREPVKRKIGFYQQEADGQVKAYEIAPEGPVLRGSCSAAVSREEMERFLESVAQLLGRYVRPFYGGFYESQLPVKLKPHPERLVWPVVGRKAMHFAYRGRRGGGRNSQGERGRA